MGINIQSVYCLAVCARSICKSFPFLALLFILDSTIRLMLFKNLVNFFPSTDLLLFHIYAKFYMQPCSLHFEGKYVNGTTMVVDGGLWLSRPRYIAKEDVRKLSRVVEKKSRNSAVIIPTSKL